jgi:DNA-binding protein HU-beta
MLYGDLVKKVAEATNASQKDANVSVAAVIEAVKVALKSGEEVRLTGFGTLTVKATKARTARNPKTGEKLELKASKRVAFKPSKQLVEFVKEV